MGRLKGQGTANVGVTIVTAAVFIIVGVMIFAQVYSSTPGINRIIVNETLSNVSVGDPNGYGTYYTAQTASKPVYLGGDQLPGGETNMTMFVYNGTAHKWVEITHNVGPAGTILTTSDTFNYTTNGAITANMSTNGTVLITYSYIGSSETYMPTFRSIQSSALNASQLLAVAVIVVAAVVILSTLFLLGRRA